MKTLDIQKFVGFMLHAKPGANHHNSQAFCRHNPLFIRSSLIVTLERRNEKKYTELLVAGRGEVGWGCVK